MYVRIQNNAGEYTLGILILEDKILVLNSPIERRICLGDEDSIVFDLEWQLSPSFQDQIGSGYFEFRFFYTLEDAENQTNEIPNSSQYLITENETLYLLVESPGRCSRIVNYNIFIYRSPVTTVSSHVVCLDEGESAYVNLFEFYNQITSTPNCILQFYNSAYDASQSNNSISNADNYGYSTTSVLFVKVINLSGCIKVVPFNLVALTEESFNYSTKIVSCDEDNNGTSLFYLPELIPLIVNDILSGFEIEYYESEEDAINEINPLPLNYESGSTTVFVKLKYHSDCEFIIPAQLEILNVSEAQNVIYKQCDENFDGYAQYQLSNINPTIIPSSENYRFQYFLSYSQAETQTNPLPDSYQNVQVNQIIYARISARNNPDCYKIVTATLSTSNLFLEGENFKRCDADLNGIEVFSLQETLPNIYSAIGNSEVEISFFESHTDACLSENPLANEVTVAYPFKDVYARVENANGCLGIVHFKLVIEETPTIDLDAFYEFCIGGSLYLNAGEHTTYLWSTGETTQDIHIDEPGNYWLEVTNEVGCITHLDIQTQYSVKPQISHIDYFPSHIQIFAMGDYAPFSFSLDGIEFQNTGLFLQLSPGIYEAYVEDNIDCLSEPFLFGVLSDNNIITPNGDGINDVWKIKGIEAFTGSYISIFDRYGKTIYQTEIQQDFEWNGKMNQTPLPSDTYWYRLSLIDGREINGYIVVKNFTALN